MLIANTTASTQELVNKILRLKEKKKAVILSHFYQESRIQDIADFVGDSLALAQYAQQVNARIIVLCGVYFMAETAKLLNPQAKVLIPDSGAGCSLVEGCPPGEFKKFIEQYDNRFVMVYINSSLEVKALADIVCTSSNAVKLLNMIPRDKIVIFAPDRHLGNYLRRVSGRELILWNATCVVHEEFNAEQVRSLKEKYPQAKVIVHPECNEHLISIADFVGSTSALLRFVIEDDAPVYIVGTEEGIVHQMKKKVPHKRFIVVPPIAGCIACQQCPYMKLNTLEKLYEVLVHETNEVTIAEELAVRALIPVKRMLEWTAM